MCLSHIITIFQTFKICGATPLPGHNSIYINLSLCTFVYSIFQNFLLFLMLILKEKKNLLKLFSCLLKCINNRYIFFELMSGRSIHQHLSQGQLNSAREVWLKAVRWPLSKKEGKKRTNKLAKSKTRNEHPGGLKTRIGRSKQKLGHKKEKYIPGGLKTRKGGPGKS